MALKLTAIATSTGGAPAPSAESMITCAGAAQISSVASTNQVAEKPRSCASVPMLRNVPKSTS